MKPAKSYPALPAPVRLLSSFLVLSGVLSAGAVYAQESVQEKNQEKVKPASTGGVNESKKIKKAKNKKVSDELEEVIITGSRLNLLDASEIKRNASTMVDAISADQIGLLPDRSTLDAMQRLPGVAIERFASPNDPDHFGVEGSDIILRGMKQTRSEFNGRDSFSAYSGRGLSYRDVPPELVGSIQVFKNQTADMIEGGIGGTVNLITRKPLDSDDRILAFSVDGSYGDLAKEFAPTFSGLYSDSFDFQFGTIGVLANYVTSELVGQSHGIQSDAYVQFYAHELISDKDPNPPGRQAADFVGEDGNGVVWVPNAANLLMKEDHRDRDGFAGAIQFVSSGGEFEALFEVIHSDSSLAWNERSIKYQGSYFTPNNRPSAPLEGTHFYLNSEGLFLQGTLVEQGNPWRVGGSGTSRVPSTNGPQEMRGYAQWGHKTQMDSRVNDTRSVVDDYSIQVKWEVLPELKFEGDLQFIKAKAEVDDQAVHLITRAMFDYDVRGSTPSLTLLEPWQGARDSARADGDTHWNNATEVDGVCVPQYPGFSCDPLGDRNFFQDPFSYAWTSAMDHYERSEGDAFAAKGDFTYEINRGPLKSIKVGARYSEREQRVRSTSWNWGQLAPEWSGGASNWDLPEGEYEGSGIGWVSDIDQLKDGVESVDWSNFMGGGVLTLPGSETIHVNESLIRSISGPNPSRQLYYSDFDPDATWQSYSARENVDSKFGLFAPDEINTTLEIRNSVYFRLDFGGDGDLPFSGNVGLRYVDMERQALGVVDFPVMAPVGRPTENFPPEDVALPLTPESVDAYLNQQVADGVQENYNQATTALANNWIRNPYNYLPTGVREFAEGIPRLDENGELLFERFRPLIDPVSPSMVAETRYKTFLPSFNIKADLTEQLVGRIAFAKSIAFPDMGDVRNRTEFANVDATDRESDDLIIQNRVVSVENAPDIDMIESVRLNRQEGGLSFVAEGGNPFMKPMESIQYDFSLEWYFSDFGQLSAAVFHKNLSNYFSRGVITRSFTNPMTQQTQPVAVTTNRNGGDAKLDGVELNYHQFFGGFFEGFGVQATYTYIDANSVPNNEKDVEDEQWFSSVYEDTGIRVNPDKLPLQGQSDHIVNLIGLYETDQWSARIAYNWRSKYLLTTRDVISKAPLWYNDHGELDGSVFYTLTDNLTIGLQVENITNEQTEINMILNDDLLEAGRSWFVSDRRFALVLRGEF